MKTFIAGVLLVVGGIWVHIHYTPVAALCRSGIGAFAQAVSPTAQQNCGTVETLVTLSPWAIGVGAVIIAGGLLLTLGAVGSAAASARNKARTRP
jgi:hypothetical protein